MFASSLSSLPDHYSSSFDSFWSCLYLFMHSSSFSKRTGASPHSQWLLTDQTQWHRDRQRNGRSQDFSWTASIFGFVSWPSVLMLLISDTFFIHHQIEFEQVVEMCSQCRLTEFHIIQYPNLIFPSWVTDLHSQKQEFRISTMRTALRVREMHVTRDLPVCTEELMVPEYAICEGHPYLIIEL